MPEVEQHRRDRRALKLPDLPGSTAMPGTQDNGPFPGCQRLEQDVIIFDVILLIAVLNEDEISGCVSQPRPDGVALAPRPIFQHDLYAGILLVLQNDIARSVGRVA